MELLKKLCQIHAPSGNEVLMKEFILDYVKKNAKNWKVKPKVIHGEDFQDCVMLVFGKPRTAIFAHMDSIGFTIRYDNKLEAIGGPQLKTSYQLVGKDSKGSIETKIVFDAKSDYIVCDFPREIDRVPNFYLSVIFAKQKSTFSLVIWTIDWGFGMH